MPAEDYMDPDLPFYRLSPNTPAADASGRPLAGWRDVRATTPLTTETPAGIEQSHGNGGAGNPASMTSLDVWGNLQPPSGYVLKSKQPVSTNGRTDAYGGAGDPVLPGVNQDVGIPELYERKGWDATGSPFIPSDRNDLLAQANQRKAGYNAEADPASLLFGDASVANDRVGLNGRNLTGESQFAPLTTADILHSQNNYSRTQERVAPWVKPLSLGDIVTSTVTGKPITEGGSTAPWNAEGSGRGPGLGEKLINTLLPNLMLPHQGTKASQAQTANLSLTSPTDVAKMAGNSLYNLDPVAGAINMAGQVRNLLSTDSRGYPVFDNNGLTQLQVMNTLTHGGNAVVGKAMGAPAFDPSQANTILGFDATRRLADMGRIQPGARGHPDLLPAAQDAWAKSAGLTDKQRKLTNNETFAATGWDRDPTTGKPVTEVDRASGHVNPNLRDLLNDNGAQRQVLTNDPATPLTMRDVLHGKDDTYAALPEVGAAPVRNLMIAPDQRADFAAGRTAHNLVDNLQARNDSELTLLGNHKPNILRNMHSLIRRKSISSNCSKMVPKIRRNTAAAMPSRGKLPGAIRPIRLLPNVVPCSSFQDTCRRHGRSRRSGLKFGME